MSRLRSAALLVAVCLLSTCAALLFAEAVVRTWYPVSVSAAGLDDIDGVTAMRKNVSGRHTVPGAYDITFSTGSQRFRGSAEYPPEPSTDTIRIAALGDSFTFGAGVEDDQTYPEDLERMLTRLYAPAGRHIEVLNAGVPGTGTGEEALYYDVWVKQFHPRLVILAVYVNDLDDDGKRRLFTPIPGGAQPKTRSELEAADASIHKVRRILGAIPGYDFVIQRSQLVNVVRLTLSEFVRRHRAGASAEPPESEATRAQALEERLALLAGEIEWLGNRVREDGAALLVVFIPHRDLVYQLPPVEELEADAAPMLRTLHALSESRRLPFADLTPDMTAAAGSSSTMLYYSGLETHATRDGYRAIAAAVARAIDADGLLEPIASTPR